MIYKKLRNIRVTQGFAVLCLLGLFIIIGLLSTSIRYQDNKIIELEGQVQQMKEALANYPPDSTFKKDWFLFKMALVKVESNFKTVAVNPTSGAGGLYQIMPIGKNGFLHEANRIIGYIEYTDTCRFDAVRANEMFEVNNQYWNPNKDILTAIKLHNPTAGNDYRDAVLKEYKLFQDISKQLGE